MATYPLPPTEFPSAFNGLGERMLHPRIAVWSQAKSDYQIYDVNRADYPTIRLNPTNSNRTSPFYFAEGPGDNQSRTFTLYRPRARIHSHVAMAIWHTGGWLCRKDRSHLEPVIPILGVSDPGKLQWVGNVGLHTEGCEGYFGWLQYQTPSFTRPIIHNRILMRSTRWEDEEESATPTIPRPDPIPLFVAETLLEKAIASADTCPISMDPLKKGSAAVTSCFHIFQREALQEWLTHHSSCPVCKKKCSMTVC